MFENFFERWYLEIAHEDGYNDKFNCKNFRITNCLSVKHSFIYDFRLEYDSINWIEDKYPEPTVSDLLKWIESEKRIIKKYNKPLPKWAIKQFEYVKKRVIPFLKKQDSTHLVYVTSRDYKKCKP